MGDLILSSNICVDDDFDFDLIIIVIIIKQ